MPWHLGISIPDWHNVPVFENLANLDELPEAGFTVIAMPMKIAAGTGAPLRIVAIVPK